jgi:tRNA(Arg) A34 adenosine deaminase TadA
MASGYWRYGPDALLDHAEMVALRAAQKNPRIQGHRRRTTLYTTLEPCLLWHVAAGHAREISYPEAAAS